MDIEPGLARWRLLVPDDVHGRCRDLSGLSARESLRADIERLPSINEVLLDENATLKARLSSKGKVVGLAAYSRKPQPSDPAQTGRAFRPKGGRLQRRNADQAV